jgi:hypothetical protein
VLALESTCTSDPQAQLADARINLLYIASSGRSGSTLLELLIGAHSQLWTLGEFYVLPFALELSDKPCGCGTMVKDCPFWRPILDDSRVADRGQSIGRFRDGYDVGRLLQFRELPYIWSRKSGGPGRQAEVEQFGNDNARVLSAVLKQAREVKGPQVNWLIDASKSPYRLLWLKQCSHFNLRVIHLVKDPRAFVYSISKEDDGSMSRTRIARATFRWNAENYFFDRLFATRFGDEEVMRIQYEELARNPESVVQRIFDWLVVPYEGNVLGEFRGVNHGIAGNPMRHRKGGIKPDEKWREALSPAAQRLVRCVSSGLARKYGYTT